jgi:hypothetical protein
MSLLCLNNFRAALCNANDAVKFHSYKSVQMRNIEKNKKREESHLV